MAYKYSKYIIALMFLFAQTIHADKYFYINDFKYSSFPDVCADYFIFDENRRIITSYQASDFEIKDNSSTFLVEKMNCPNPNLNNFNSIVVSFDQGLGAGDTITNHYQLGLALLDTILNRINYSNTQIALTAFDVSSYLIHDFSTSKDDLSKSMLKLKRQSGSLSSNGLLSLPAGGLNISSESFPSKSMILITDGIADFDADSIIKYANDNQIRIFVVYLGHANIELFKKIAQSTSGAIFRNINDFEDIKRNVFNLLALVEGYKPCTISWKDAFDCSNIHDVSIRLLSENQTESFSFAVHDTIKPTIESNPVYLEYSSVLAGTKKSKDITIQAINSDLYISKIYVESPLFKITSGALSSPIVLNKNSKHNLTIEFSPVDSALVFTKLIIESNACFGKEILITGGFPNKPPKDKTIKITNPVCGNTLVVGDTIDVTWHGLLPKDMIQLEYSLNYGKKWYSLSKDIDNLSYKWVVPNLETDSLMIRAIQLWPNNVGQTLDLPHAGAVNSAFFNKTGDKVITASDDSTAKLWNSNNAQLIRTFKPHNHAVNYASIDNFEKFIVTASADGSVRLWDTTGKLIKKMNHDNGANVLSACFNPNGDRIISAGSDYNVNIWDLNGNIVKQIKMNQVRFACYDNSGSKILITANDGIARIYSSDGTKIDEINTKEPGDMLGYSKHGSFNHDGTKICVTNDIYRRTLVYDIPSKKRLYTLSHNMENKDSSYILNSANFFYNNDEGKEYILTSGMDGASKRWIASDGSIPKGKDGKDSLHVFLEHRKSVQTSVFNFDGSRLLTASWDSTAKIWNLNHRGLQIDSTDCPIRIKRAKAKTRDIDFGDVVVNEVSIKTTNDFIVNSQDFAYKIRSIEIISGDTDDFAVLSDISRSIVLEPFSNQEIIIRFKPSQSGKRQIRIRIITPSDTIYSNVFGNGIAVGLAVNPGLIYFGQVETDEFKDTTLVSVITNKSTLNLTIDSIAIAGPDTSHFDLLNLEEFPLTLAPGQSKTLTFRFIPESEGRKNCVIELHHNAAGSPAKFNLFGEGASPYFDTLKVKISDISGQPGDEIELPVILESNKPNLLLSGLKSINFRLSFNSTLLAPLDNYNIDFIDNDIRTIQCSFPYNQNPNKEIGRIKFKVALGNDTISKLLISELETVGTSKLFVRPESSWFRLNGWCNEGEPRLFDPNGKLSMDMVKPNPIVQSSLIKIVLRESGPTSLKVYNYLGICVKTYFDEVKAKGEYQISIDSRDYSAGKYYYILETVNGSIQKSFEVIK